MGALRHLEVGKGALQRINNAGFGRSRAVWAPPSYDRRNDGLAEVRMGHAEDGGFENTRHEVDHLLDLLRIDVQPAADDEIL